MPAQSPTLSPTLSAITAGLRGSSSGMLASTLPTRSAPTSAPLVKMPPPRRAKTEISEPPKARPTSASGSCLPAACMHERDRRQREEARADHHQAGDGAALEGQVEGAPEAGAGRLGHAQVGAHRHVHADEAGRGAGQRADQEAERVPAAEQQQDQHAGSARRPSPRCGTAATGRPRRRRGSPRRSRWRAAWRSGPRPPCDTGDARPRSRRRRLSRARTIWSMKVSTAGTARAVARCLGIAARRRRGSIGDAIDPARMGRAVPRRAAC